MTHVLQAEQLDGDGNQALPPGFHLVYLPFADDMRKLTYEPAAVADEVSGCGALWF